jgi:predicted dehydrogenase
LQSTRWAIFGTGEVAGKFVQALKRLPDAEVTLCTSRTDGRAQAFAQRFGIAQARTGFELRPGDDVDIVYIATPPSEHLAHALAAIGAGKAVLIEKPFAADAADARRIVEAARRAGVFCMEGLWTRFLPALATARQLLAQGAIGEVRSLWGSFAVAQKVQPGNSLFDRAAVGGALAHRGAYPLSLALDLLGPATLVAAWARIGATGVDEDVSATLLHPGGAASHIYAGLRSQADNSLVILGEAGRMTLRGPIYRPLGVSISRVRPRGRGTPTWRATDGLKDGAFMQGLRSRLAPFLEPVRTYAAPYAGNGYGHQAAAAMQAMREGRLEHERMSLADTLAAAELMDEIRRSWRAAAPAEGA